MNEPRSETEAEARVLSVAQLVRWAARSVEQRFPSVWVEGEVSNLKRPSSGHLYFTLKDRHAQLAVVVFRSTAQRSRCRLEDGQTYRLRGRLSIYEPQGRFQLTAEQIEAKGVGALLLAIEELKAKLAAEGLFDEARKRPLPALPKSIAVVTSRSGAALQDILRVLAGRWPVDVVLVPAPVQGRDAPWELSEALERADALGCDLLLLARGGGSLEDLQAFNHERVARTLAALRTPTVCGVGHEIDVTIADLVADRRAPTPSAAAEVAVPTRAALEQRLAVTCRRLAQAGARRVEGATLRLERLQARLGAPEQLIHRRRQELDDLAARLQGALRHQVQRRRDALGQLLLRATRQRPTERLARDRARLVALESRGRTALASTLAARRRELARRVAALDALSPLAVLGRGYSIVQDGAGERVLRAAGDVEVGSPIRIRLARGRLRARVEEILED